MIIKLDMTDAAISRAEQTGHVTSELDLVRRR